MFRRSPLESFTLAIVGGLTGIVIPTLFGLLGTLAGLMRTITAKTRGITPAPRDHQVARVAVVQGMSAGLSVGLFFDASDPSGDIAKGIDSTITVSAARLSFLAGSAAKRSSPSSTESWSESSWWPRRRPSGRRV